MTPHRPLVLLAIGLLGVGMALLTALDVFAAPRQGLLDSAGGDVVRADPTRGSDPLEASASSLAGSVSWSIESVSSLRRVEPARDLRGVIEVVGGGSNPVVELVGGPATVRPHAMGRHLVAIHGPRDGTFVRCLQLLRPNGRKRVLRLGSRQRASGRVVDREGAPVVGAKVWFGAFEPGPGLGQPRLATTDEDGAFAFEGVPVGRGIPLVVAAPGYASTWQSTEFVGGGLPVRTVVMQPAAADLEVLLTAGVEFGTDGVAWCAPAANGAVPTALRAYPFFVAGLDSLHDALFPSGRGAAGCAAINERGVARFTDLPVRVELDLWARHPGLVHAASARVMTSAKRASRRALMRGRGESCGVDVLRVVGLDGAPIVGASIERAGRATSETFGSAFMLAPAMHEGPTPQCSVRTDQDGLVRIPPGEWFVSAPGRYGSVVRAGGEVVLPPVVASVGRGPSDHELAIAWDSVEGARAGAAVRVQGPDGRDGVWDPGEPLVLQRFDAPSIVCLRLGWTLAGGVAQTRDVTVTVDGSCVVPVHAPD